LAREIAGKRIAAVKTFVPGAPVASDDRTANVAAAAASAPARANIDAIKVLMLVSFVHRC